MQLRAPYVRGSRFAVEQVGLTQAAPRALPVKLCILCEPYYHIVTLVLSLSLVQHSAKWL
jgi:hypothetical protein